jgi:iron(III) transport system substrate-binding protein
MKARRSLAPALVAASVAVLAAACGGGGGGGGNSIVLYNGQHVQLTNSMVAAFQKQSGITVRTRTNDGVVLADQILQEGSTSPADVYLTENSPELMHLQESGLLARLPASVLDKVPAADRSPNGDWVGVALRISTLVYDPSKISRSELPKSILDLADPKWKGKVAFAPLDSDFPPLVGGMIATHGEAAAKAWLTGLKRNAQTYQDDESVVYAVNRGDVAVGVINQYYWYRLRFEVGASAMHSALYYFPRGDVGSLVNISGAAVLASSKHKAEAEKFVGFMVSAAGQKLISAGDDYEYPVTSVAPNKQLPPLSSVPHTDLSVVKLGDDKQAASLIEAVGFGG